MKNPSNWPIENETFKSESVLMGKFKLSEGLINQYESKIEDLPIDEYIQT